MLFLCFKVGEETYGIRASEIREVIPLVPLDRVPGSEATVAGIFNYRGSPLPVIDLCQYFQQQPCRQILSSRIIIIQQQLGEQVFDVGLIAEHVTETVQVEASRFQSSGVKNTEQDFLGDIMPEAGRLIQIINTHRLIPDSMRRALEQAVEQSAS